MDTYRYGPSIRLPYSNTSGSQVDSGEVVNVNANLFGIAVADTPDGEDGVLEIGGVHELARDSADAAWVQGAELYWNGSALTNSTADDIIGVAAEDAGTDDTTATVVLNQAPLATG